MKVLYITTMYPTPVYPQKGIFCHEQVKALKKLGIDVDVVVPTPFYDPEIKVKEWYFEGITIKYVKFFKLPGARDFHRTGNSLFRILKNRLNLAKYDLYHADAPLPSGYAAMLASNKYGIPFIVHGHGLDVFLEESYKGQKNRADISENCRMVYEKANAVVGVSQKVLDKIQKRVDILGKSYVVYNGVDTDKFLPVNTKKNDTDRVVITSIGNLIPLKGHEYTLQAIKRMVDEGYKNIRFRLAGRGELEEKLKKLSEKLDINEYVEFMGYISYSDIMVLLQKSDIFVLPSYYEALGCVYLEAMSCAVPAIGCKNNGIDEIIIDGVNGYLVDNKNVDQIAECLRELMNQEKRLAVGEKARESVIKKYQWKNSAENLAKIYHSLNL